MLLRENNERQPGSGFEIARGDKMICWSQLELATKDRDEDSVLQLDDVACALVQAATLWSSALSNQGRTCPAWSYDHNEQDVERLHLGYRLAKSIFAGRVKHHEVGKRVHGVPGSPEKGKRTAIPC